MLAASHVLEPRDPLSLEVSSFTSSAIPNTFSEACSLSPSSGRQEKAPNGSAWERLERLRKKCIA